MLVDKARSYPLGVVSHTVVDADNCFVGGAKAFLK